MSSNRNYQGVRIAVLGRPARIAGFRSWPCREERPTFENLAGGELWNVARTAEIARARRLIQNDDYPNEAVICSIARLLSEHF
jgi:hypothetical protein